MPLWAHAAHCLLTGHMHMDEMVALAILAAMATGEYQTAGVVAFFLLLSMLIESRTALGARAAIEGLMRLTPTKARRSVVPWPSAETWLWSGRITTEVLALFSMTGPAPRTSTGSKRVTGLSRLHSSPPTLKRATGLASPSRPTATWS